MEGNGAFTEKANPATPGAQGVNTAGEIEKPMFSDETAVLVCEDSEMNQWLIREQLKQVGLKATIAKNGKIGVEIVKNRAERGKKPFDLILMDIHMPVMGGLEAAGLILPMETGAPIVALTANVMSSDCEHYLKGGMDSCLGKPFTSQELWACLLKYLKPAGAAEVIEHGGEDDFAGQLKIDFVKGNRNKFDKIRNALDGGDFVLAHRLAHTLKSNAALIGKPGLQKAAMEIERLLADGENRTGKEHIDLLGTELSAVLEELAPLLEAAEKEKKAAEKLDKAAALELLERLRPLLNSGNPECLKMTETLRGIEGGETLIEQMENFDFRPAAETLAGLKKALEEG